MDFVYLAACFVIGFVLGMWAESVSGWFARLRAEDGPAPPPPPKAKRMDGPSPPPPPKQ